MELKYCTLDFSTEIISFIFHIFSLASDDADCFSKERECFEVRIKGINFILIARNYFDLLCILEIFGVDFDSSKLTHIGNELVGEVALLGKVMPEG
jgi:hypothetical protein